MFSTSRTARLALASTLMFTALASVPQASAQMSMQRVSSADRSYLQDNAQGSVYDLALASLGMQRGSTRSLYNYARQVVRDHDRLNLRLLALGRTQQVDLPLTLMGSDSARLMTLMNLRGKAFDQAFVKEEIRINSEDVSQSAQELRTTRNSGVRSFVNDFHSTEARHLREAQSMNRMM